MHNIFTYKKRKIHTSEYKNKDPNSLMYSIY